MALWRMEFNVPSHIGPPWPCELQCDYPSSQGGQWRLQSELMYSHSQPVSGPPRNPEWITSWSLEGIHHTASLCGGSHVVRRQEELNQNVKCPRRESLCSPLFQGTAAIAIKWILRADRWGNLKTKRWREGQFHFGKVKLRALSIWKEGGVFSGSEEECNKEFNSYSPETCL